MATNEDGTDSGDGGGTGGQQGGGGESIYEAVAQLYRTALGREGSAAEIHQWADGKTAADLAGIQQAIYNSDEAKAYSAKQTQKGQDAGAATGDDAIRAQIAKWAAMPDADPSLSNDPEYWLRRIKETGGLTDANRQYWQDASVGANAFFKNPNRESGGQAGQDAAAPLNQIGSYRPPPPPHYVPYDPGMAPTPNKFVAPTAEEARNTPGYQFALEQGNLGLQRSAAARGGLLSGGALKDISAYNVGMADQNYQNVWNNAFNANEAGNADALNAYLGNANAHIGAGNLNLAGAQQEWNDTYLPSWNAYQSSVGQGQFNANFGLQRQNQFWNQGFAENQNAYNQYDNSQKTAFDQWYKLMQAGHPGNPYA